MNQSICSDIATEMLGTLIINPIKAVKAIKSTYKIMLVK